MLLEQLRAETRAHHARLETALPLMDAQLTRDQYARLLGGFLGFVRPWEAAVAQALPEGLQVEFQRRAKTRWLDADLTYLGAGTNVPHCRKLPRLPEGAVLGSWYVLEGSTLGGQVLSRRLGPLLGLTSTAGMVYFSGYGPQTGERWRSFCHLLETHVAPESRGDAIAAACDTFTALHDWLSPMAREWSRAGR